MTGSNTKGFPLTGINILRLINGALGFISVTVGFYSFVGSDWKKKDIYKYCTRCNGPRNISLGTFHTSESEDPLNCPTISMELFYVEVIISGFILSTIIFITAALCPKLYQRFKIKYLDMAIHGIFAALVLTSSCIFIYSAVEIDKLLDTLWNCKYPPPPASQFLTGGKIVAGILSLKLGVLYGLLAFNVFKESGKEVDDSFYVLE